MKFRIPWIKIMPSILFLGVFCRLVLRLSQLTVEEILSYTPDSVFLAGATLLGLYLLKPFVVLLPVVILYISAGILFPPFWAFVVTYLGLFITVSAGYRLGRFMGREKAERLIGKSEKAAVFSIPRGKIRGWLVFMPA